MENDKIVLMPEEDEVRQAINTAKTKAQHPKSTKSYTTNQSMLFNANRPTSEN